MSDIDAWRLNILENIKSAGLLIQSRLIPLDNGTKGIKGKLRIDNYTVSVKINIDLLRIHRLPIFYLDSNQDLGFIPHISPDGQICFFEQEGIVFDWNRPIDVIQECIVHVKRTLYEGLTGKNHEDFINEFMVYWAELPNKIDTFVDFRIPYSAKAGEIFIASNQNELLICDDIKRIPFVARNPYTKGPWTTHSALYLSLELDTVLLPPQTELPFWGLDGVQRLWEHCSQETQEQIKSLLLKSGNSHKYMMVNLPRSKSESIYFGFYFETLYDNHPLINKSASRNIKPLYIHRRDKMFMLQRGGGNNSLINKNILLIGCGSVGGSIANELARAGIENLTFVDPDILEPENTYRHVLGRNHWNKPKVNGLKNILQQQFPYMKLQSWCNNIEILLERQIIDLSSYDLILCATGNPTLELALNEKLHSLKCSVPIIFTWVDPYGIGGHALLTGLKGSKGCLECLYTGHVDDDYLNNRASFAAPNQIFRKNIAGCAGMYTPYASLDALQTALLATRLALGVLVSRVNENRICSWKGDATEFTSQGFQLSSRYHLTSEKILEQETSFTQANCRICSAE